MRWRKTEPCCILSDLVTLTSLARAALGAVGLAAVLAVAGCTPSPVATARPSADHSSQTQTPISHLVVIFQENVSFDHYFATYPTAANPAGEPAFTAAQGTPAVNGLSGALLTSNPNATQPFRLGRSQVQTCDQDHGYADEQAAFDGGRMDKFVETVGRGPGTCPSYGKGAGLVMGYYDGNTVTALWNYAQHFAMSDNSYGTTFGPSSPGALNLIAGQTEGFAVSSPAVTSSGTVIGDPQPAGDACQTRDTTTVVDGSAKNIGDLLTANNVSWGWFQGGFADCGAAHHDVAGSWSQDYIPHHDPFQYFASTANLKHARPSSVAEIGHAGPANHQYDLSDFWSAVGAASMPAVSFLKAPGYQDGHAGYSTPLDEQTFLVDTINRLEKSRDWASTAVVIAYDDSDGWYDHQMGPVVSTSADRRGYGPRLPLLVISPYARANFVDHTVTDQSSILRFIEDNWSTGRIGNGSFDALAGSLTGMFDFSTDAGQRNPALTLDPETGLVTH